MITQIRDGFHRLNSRWKLWVICFNRCNHGAHVFILLGALSFFVPSAVFPDTARGFVLAFYYGWYGTPEVSGAWNHWDAGGKDPLEKVNGRRQIASAHYPESGVYDSNDEKTILRHLKLAEKAGISGFIVSWWGQHSFEEKTLLKMMDVIEKNNSSIRVAIYIEDIPNHNKDEILPILQHIVFKFCFRKSYLVYQWKPVIFVYGRAIYPSIFCLFEACEKTPPKRIDWTSAIAEIKKFQPVWLLADAILYTHTFFNNLSDLAAMGFNGVHVYNAHQDLKIARNLKLSTDDLYKTWVEEAHKLKLFSAVTVIPGYDDRWAGRSVSSVTEREGGKLYTRLWDGAIASGAPWVLITSFNEWHEGSEIEPSREFGNLYMRLTKEKSGQFVKGKVK